MRITRILILSGIAMFASWGLAQQARPAEGDYKVLKVDKVGGAGGWDYCFADAEGRKLYIPRSGGRGGAGTPPASRSSIWTPSRRSGKSPIGAHGAVVAKSHHGFATSNPVAMFDTKTLAIIKTIDVEGNPDGIMYDASNDRVYVLSHRAPNATVIDATDGSIAGTIDLGGAPEQAASDGKGHVYVDLEDKGNIAVVDAKTLKRDRHYDLAGKGGDLRRPRHGCEEQHPLRRLPQPRDHGDAERRRRQDHRHAAHRQRHGWSAFNPKTMEAFSSQGDGTLTIIKENSPTSFAVEQNGEDPVGGPHLDAGYQDQSDLSDHRRVRPVHPSRGGAGRGARNPGRPAEEAAVAADAAEMVPDSFTIVVVGK